MYSLRRESALHIDDIGSKDEIRKFADELGAEIKETALESQLRCGGSGDYIEWVDDVLEIGDTETPEDIGLIMTIGYSIHRGRLHEAVERTNEQTDLSRVVAGYCWEWDTDGQSDPDYVDIEIGDSDVAGISKVAIHGLSTKVQSTRWVASTRARGSSSTM